MAKSFVHFWESLEDKKEAKDRAARVLKPIKTYNKKAKKVLELGVGIGAVLDNFPKKFLIYGLDIEEDYIDVCKKKIKRGKFFVSSMHNFKVHEEFDVVFSVFDSINFLEDFNQWKSTFLAVSQHLKESGLFIFDMYTPRALQHFRGKEATASKFPKGYVYDQALVRGNTLTWDFKIFEKITEDTYQIHEYEFTERIYPVSKVKHALTQQFEILKTRHLEEGRKILFVCRKK
ncbi:MAG: class I SAM-dependent methyltransferase [Candidatus Bathyarchaeota archaeon]|nr:MAG: class I SAM-dependent methyltransferase [Candidatus Bathyarchaeota archaeon]